MAHLTVFSLFFSPAMLPASAGGMLEGLVVDVGGRAASGYRVHLIDDGGDTHASSATDARGLYSFRGLAAGEYSLGIESAAGQFAPVAAAPVRVGDGELVRRDVKLLQADHAAVDRAVQANHAFGDWWGDLSAGAKVWTVLGVVAVIGITAAALDDDEARATSSDLE